MRKLLMISTDRKIFEEGSAVRARQIEYAKEWDEVHIIIFSKNLIHQSADGDSISPNCFVYSTGSWFRFMYPFDAIRLGKFIVDQKGITNITCQDSSLTAMAGISLRKQAARHSQTIMLEIQIHEDIGSPKYGFTPSNRIRKFMATKYIPEADTIRVVSDRIEKYLVNNLRIDPAKIILRPITVDTEWIKSSKVDPRYDLHRIYPKFEKIVLMVTRLESEKNVSLAIEAWTAVLEKHPRAGLVIVGDGRQRKMLESKVIRQGIDESVIFAGWTNHEILASYYKTADLFLNTSIFEGYGMTLVEAKAASCKIISTDVGIAREIGADIVGWNAVDVARGIVTKLGV